MKYLMELINKYKIKFKLKTKKNGNTNTNLDTTRKKRTFFN
jgi:hypothetical protein